MALGELVFAICITSSRFKTLSVWALTFDVMVKQNGITTRNLKKRIIYFPIHFLMKQLDLATKLCVPAYIQK